MYKVGEATARTRASVCVYVREVPCVWLVICICLSAFYAPAEPWQCVGTEAKLNGEGRLKAMLGPAASVFNHRSTPPSASLSSLPPYLNSSPPLHADQAAVKEAVHHSHTHTRTHRHTSAPTVLSSCPLLLSSLPPQMLIAPPHLAPLPISTASLFCVFMILQCHELRKQLQFGHWIFFCQLLNVWICQYTGP